MLSGFRISSNFSLFARCRIGKGKPSKSPPKRAAVEAVRVLRESVYHKAKTAAKGGSR